jgi:type II secretory ATPase GspE/PulE/Tfp pilus assembly ATPase PilB-like protein
MAGNIIGIVAQRLVRILCPNCREPYTPSDEELQVLGQEAAQIYRPVGCRQCNHKGYKGRTAIMEILVMDGDLDELVARRATAREIRAAALTKSFRPLAEEAVKRVLDGTSSLAEVTRAVDLTGRYV